MWSRLCVDVDHRGNVRGASVELHDVDGPTTIWSTAVGPFDDVDHAMQLAAAWLSEHVGAQASLF